MFNELNEIFDFNPKPLLTSWIWYCEKMGRSRIRDVMLHFFTLLLFSETNFPFLAKNWFVPGWTYRRADRAKYLCNVLIVILFSGTNFWLNIGKVILTRKEICPAHNARKVAQITQKWPNICMLFIMWAQFMNVCSAIGKTKISNFTISTWILLMWINRTKSLFVIRYVCHFKETKWELCPKCTHDIKQQHFQKSFYIKFPNIENITIWWKPQCGFSFQLSKVSSTIIRHS